MIPIERSTPYSQIASCMFYVMDISRRKNEMKSAINAIMKMNTSKIVVIDFAASTIACFVNRKAENP